jgi:hypothetical protein
MNGYHCALIACLVFAGNAFAAAAPGAASSKTVTVKEPGGSTIIGDQDSAMGLTLMPWKDEFATGLDQPPSLYRAPLEPVNGNSLQRQTEYRDNLSDYRRSHSQYTP